MSDNDLGLEMEFNEIYKFLKTGCRMRTSVCPAALVLHSVNLAFSQSSFEKPEDAHLYHFFKKQSSDLSQMASRSQGQVYPLSLFQFISISCTKI